MNNNALITMKSKQDIEGEEDLIEVTTVGNYSKKGNKFYVTYEGSEISGYDGSKTTIKINNTDNSLMLLRRGSTTTQMFFERGNKYTGLYNTPFGVLTVDVSTKDLKIDVGEDGGEVSLDYFVGINNEFPVRNSLYMQIKKSGGTADDSI